MMRTKLKPAPSVLKLRVVESKCEAVLKGISNGNHPHPLWRTPLYSTKAILITTTNVKQVDAQRSAPLILKQGRGPQQEISPGNDMFVFLAECATLSDFRYRCILLPCVASFV